MYRTELTQEIVVYKMVVKIASILLLSVVFDNSFAKFCSCGRENVDSRIVGGTTVSRNKYPWMASLLIEKNFGSRTKAWTCGGSLINDRYILTAAHCLDENPTQITAWLGSNTKYEGKRVAITKATKAYYDPYRKHNDIALLKLAEPIEFTREISPICLPTPEMTKFDMLTVAGWGMTRGGGMASHYLLEVTVPETPFEECNYRRRGRLTESQLCAAAIGKDSCGGDSGGPLMSRKSGKNFVVGIVSYGAADCGSDLDSVYTRVTSFLDWIKRNTLDAEYCDL